MSSLRASLMVIATFVAIYLGGEASSVMGVHTVMAIVKIGWGAMNLCFASIHG
jgi:hypothetical protein